MSSTTRSTTNISQKKLALLKKLRQKEGGGEHIVSTAPLTIPKRNDRQSYPLSFAQQRLWFLDQMEPGTPIYNLTVAWHLNGHLNVHELERSLGEILQRHEALRSNFRVVEGNAIQRISPQGGNQLRYVDLQTLPPSQREQEALRLLTRENEQPFDLAQDSLLRATLFCLDEHTHLLVLCQHHIVSDAWSIGVLRYELVTLYNAFVQGLPSPLPALPLQYADFASWQRDWLRGEALEQQLAYWREQLSGAPTALQLPTDWPRPAILAFDGAVCNFRLPKRLCEALQTLCYQENVTLFMLLLAAFNILLCRYSNQEDILVGTPIANRTHTEIEGLIGFFVNTLVLRSDLSGNPPFRELLRRVREVALGAYSYQDIPFERIVEAVQPERSLSRSPLFQVMFSLQNAGMPGKEFLDITSHAMGIDEHVAKFELSFDLQETSEGIEGQAEYNTDLFAATTIERLVNHYQQLLNSIVSEPDQPIGNLSLFTEAEYQQLVVEWNETTRVYPHDQCIQQLFEAQVEHTPERTAFIFEHKQLTYRELNERANQLAHYLQTQGVGPEVLVGLCMERSAEQMIGLLAILKAGGAYVPIDPGYPRERIAFILHDAEITLLLTLQHLQEQLALVHAGTLLCLDSDWPQLAAQSTANLSRTAQVENSAYVIYTSGSTGTPKGVQVSQRALVNHCTAIQHHYQITPSDRMLHFASLSFDAAVEELFPAWCSGATVVSRPRELPGTFVAFVEFITTHSLTILDLPTAYWQHWVEAMEEDKGAASLPATLRLLIVGGEEAKAASLTSWLRHVGDAVRWSNTYGPTEATVTTTVYDYNAPISDEVPPRIPIGRPLANALVYVLDRRLQPVPMGVPGELHIGGKGVASGYLKRPELTNERFIADPFCGEPGARLYRTGDLVRYLPDGNLEFLGRIDQQVKIRGFRIELGEIEAALNQYPTVQQVVVVAREDRTGDNQLVAYVVAAEQETEGEWRRYLRERLPEYMVPAVFLRLEAFPLTSNNKVDRQALPAPELVGSAVEYIPPRTALEKQLAQIWEQILGLERVGVQENFFALGGHSLKATQIISRAQQASGVMVPLRSLFEDPTIAGLAHAIEQIPAQTPAMVHSSIQPSSQEMRQRDLQIYLEGLPEEEIQALLTRGTHEQAFNVFPVSFVQQRMWFLDQIVPDTTVYTIPEGMRLVGKLHRRALEQALDAIVSRHEALRTVFPAVGGRPVQLVASPTPLQIFFYDLSQLPEGERDEALQLLITEETQHPFSLATGPLFRSVLLRLAEEEHVLLLVVHHIVFDGWSQEIMIQELVQLYEAFATNQPSPLPPLPLQYADYTHWQREWLQGPAMHDQLTFWQQQLHGPLPQLTLLADRPRPPVQTFAGAEYSFTLPLAMTKALTALSQREGVTLFMTLLAAFTVVLSGYSGQTDVLIGTPIANRTRTEVESLIGCFINTLVLRTDLADNPSLHELLKRVQQVALDAYAHQDLPFEKVVEEVHPERDLSRSPLFQVMFIFQNAAQHALTLRDLAIEFLPMPLQVAKFDLTLSLGETVEGLSGCFEYNTDVFEEATLVRLATYLHRVLQAMLSQPAQLVSEVALLTPDERELILQQWNDTRSVWPEDICIHQLIEAQVEQTPNAVAVIFEQQTLTYREVNERANQLAHYLQLRGVGPEVIVGICMERSLDMVVGLLGILKAGGAYLPLDPAYPSERIAFMLEDTQTPLIITQRALRATLPQTRAAVFCCEEEEIAAQPTRNLESEVRAEQLAYIIYTSGSTGRPKGVMIEHRNAMALLHWVHKTFTEQELARTLMATSICFDLSVFELFAPLSKGGAVILAENALHLLTLAKTHQVTLINTVPSVMTELLRGGDLPHCVRVVNLAGETLPLRLVQQLYQVPSLEKVYNLYGPSEDTTYSTAALLVRGGQVTIGYPIANSQAYVLDAHLQPVPPGVPGELYLGGAGLARGYLNQPALTAERFVTDPFGREGGARLYRTGDLVRYRGDGALEFLGRIDQQVKIRGFRIELGEIEAVLRQHPGVQEGIVVAQHADKGDYRLVAYVVAMPEEESVFSVHQLHAFLQQSLPNYMLPSAIVLLAALPLTPNGKVDRRALTLSEHVGMKPENNYVAPRDALELQLVHIWEELLHVHPLGIADNFFELGGHSLLVVRLMAWIERAFGQVLPLATLFQGATIEHQAYLLRQRQTVSSRSPLVPMQTQGTLSPLFLVHPVGGNVLCYLKLSQHLGTEQPVYGLQAPGLNGEQAPFTSLSAMAAYYITALREVQAQGPYMLGGWSMGGVVAFEMAQQLLQQGEQIALLALFDSYVPLEKARAEDATSATVQFAQDLGKLFGKDLSITYEALHVLTAEEQTAYILVQLQQERVIPPDMGVQQIQYLLQVFRANLLAVEQYRVQQYPGCLTLFRASEDVGEDQQASSLGWERYTEQGVTTYITPGNHYTMLQETAVVTIADMLASLKLAKQDGR